MITFKFVYNPCRTETTVPPFTLKDLCDVDNKSSSGHADVLYIPADIKLTDMEKYNGFVYYRDSADVFKLNMATNEVELAEKEYINTDMLLVPCPEDWELNITLNGEST